VKKPRGECKVNVYESGVIGMIELIETKQKGQLEGLDDLDALNQLKQPSRFADGLSGCIQDQEHTGCPGACRAPMDLQRVTQGECVLAE